MADVNRMIRSAARNRSVQPYILEKDYALSYLLAGIHAAEVPGEKLVLKGGTALRKFYFADYRFSEDLDYSTRIACTDMELDALMETAVELTGRMLYERGPFRVEYEPLVLKQPHPGEQKAYLVRVQFPSQRQPLCRLKVEVSVDEPVLLPAEERLLLHGFPEDLRERIPVYALPEIAAEKLRALLQSRKRLQERGWGASRVCRDYYDLWNLLQVPGLISPGLISLLDRKCTHRKVAYDSANDFIGGDLLDVAKSEWDQQLLPFVGNAPPVGEILGQVQQLILSIWD